MGFQKKILILSYYWPPSGGSGVQRWMYFAKYLKRLGWEPVVITVDEKQASYPVIDLSLLEEVKNIRVIKTSTREPLRLYSWLRSGSTQEGIPQGELATKSFFGKLAAYVRGNFFIPDARKGWVPFAVKAAQKILIEEEINHLITTGPPHSTHLAGLELSNQFKINWWVDFRDPWTDVFYNKQMQRTQSSEAKDVQIEKNVLQKANGVITTLGGDLHQSLKRKAPNQKFIAIANGFDAELIASSKAHPLEDVFHLVYTGLLTQQQAYSSIIKALQKLDCDRPIRFSLAGNISERIIEEIRMGLPKVEIVYHGYLDHAAAVALMKSAHLLLNFIFDGAKTQMISGKLLEYTATEVPILSIGDPNSEAAKFINKGSCAVMLDSNDLEGIISFISKVSKYEGILLNIFPEIENWSRESLSKELIKKCLG